MRSTLPPALTALLLAATLAAPAPAHGDVYALTDAGDLFRSTDAGTTWTPLGATGASGCVAIRPGAVPGDLLVLNRTGDLRRSTDAGATWGLPIGNVGAPDCVDLAADRAENLVVLSTSGRLHRSTDSGATWIPEPGLGQGRAAALCVAGAGATGDSLVAVTEAGVTLLSTGAGWTVRGATGQSGILDVVWADGQLLALGRAGDVFHSTDAGSTWTARATVSQVGMRAITREPGGGWMIAGDRGDIARSPDADLWSWVGTVNQVYVADMAADSPEFTGAPLIVAPAAPRLRAWPNPFRSQVHFSLPGDPSGVRLEVLDVSGRRVADLSAARSAGGIWTWNAAAQPPAVYFVRAVWDGRTAATRVTRIR